MKIPRDLSGQTVAKALQRLGFVRVRQRGSHATFHHSELDLEVTVPMKPKVAVGTVAAILRRAQMDLEEFLAAL